jgi:hypothetical protein
LHSAAAMTTDPARNTVFTTHAQAADYLEQGGFIFAGAPDRWHQIRKGQMVTAHIMASNRIFYVIFAPSKTV